MKIGLYTIDFPADLGGGYVLRDDISRAALAYKGRHTFELAHQPSDTNRVLAKAERLLGRPNRTAQKRFRKEVARRKFDLLWFNHFNPIYTDTPYILNIFDLQHRLQPWFPEVSAGGVWQERENLLKEGIQRAALVTVGSEEAKIQLCHFYGVPLENVWILPFPTPQKALDIARGAIAAPPVVDVRAKYGIRNPFLFYPAQLWSHKNHVNLFRALALLKTRGRLISLVLTGADHGNRDYLEATARALGVTEQVHFCGFVPYEDILSFYREASALSYTSFFGPENLPPLEAMALECPVILSDIPGVRALHGEAPVLVEPRNPNSIADGVTFVLDHPDEMRARAKLGKAVAVANNYERYFENFQRMLDAFEPVRSCWP
jgi:glycosyltransferase involved in cell wall biosynthesis